MVICLSGWKSSGKDSLATYLVEKYGFVRTSFADPLKDLVASEFEIDRASLDDPERKEAPLLHLPVDPKDPFTKMLAEFMFKEFRDNKGRQPIKFITGDSFLGVFSDASNGVLYQTPRSLAILKGSTNRFVASNFWVQKAINRIKNLDDECKFHVISDFRYQSEGSQLMEAFGKDAVFVRINRFKDSPSQDPSERDLDQYLFDYHIDNTGTLEEAYKQMDGILGFYEKD